MHSLFLCHECHSTHRPVVPVLEWLRKEDDRITLPTGFCNASSVLFALWWYWHNTQRSYYLGLLSSVLLYASPPNFLILSNLTLLGLLTSQSFCYYPGNISYFRLLLLNELNDQMCFPQFFPLCVCGIEGWETSLHHWHLGPLLIGF